MRITIDKLAMNDWSEIIKEIAGAGNAFAHAIYMYSKLPLRVFEAAE